VCVALFVSNYVARCVAPPDVFLRRRISDAFVRQRGAETLSRRPERTIPLVGRGRRETASETVPGTEYEIASTKRRYLNNARTRRRCSADVNTERVEKCNGNCF